MKNNHEQWLFTRKIITRYTTAMASVLRKLSLFGIHAELPALQEISNFEGYHYLSKRAIFSLVNHHKDVSEAKSNLSRCTKLDTSDRTEQ
jgi:hypothetical protein